MSWSFGFKAKNKQVALTELSAQKESHKDHFPKEIEEVIAKAIGDLKHTEVYGMETHINVESSGHLGEYGGYGSFKVELLQVKV